MALEGAMCHSELSSIENPEQHFEKVFKRLELPSRLQRHVLEAFVSGAPANELLVEVVSSLNQEARISYANSRGLNTLLELKIRVTLDDTLFTLDGSLSCLPWVRSEVIASLQRVSDGAIIAKNSFPESSSVSKNPLTFQKMLTDESVIVEFMEQSFFRIANRIRKWISPTQP